MAKNLHDQHLMAPMSLLPDLAELESELIMGCSLLDENLKPKHMLDKVQTLMSGNGASWRQARMETTAKPSFQEIQRLA